MKTAYSGAVIQKTERSTFGSRLERLSERVQIHIRYQVEYPRNRRFRRERQSGEFRVMVRPCTRNPIANPTKPLERRHFRLLMVGASVYA